MFHYGQDTMAVGPATLVVKWMTEQGEAFFGLCS